MMRKGKNWVKFYHLSYYFDEVSVELAIPRGFGKHIKIQFSYSQKMLN